TRNSCSLRSSGPTSQRRTSSRPCGCTARASADSAGRASSSCNPSRLRRWHADAAEPASLIRLFHPLGARIGSTILLCTVVILCIRFLGPAGGVWLVTALGVLTLYEFYGLLRRMGIEHFNRVGLPLAALLCLAPSYLEPHGIGTSAIVALAVIVFSIRILGEREAHSRVETLAWTLF